MGFAEDVPEQVLYSNAHYALEQIDKGVARGARWRLRIRSAIEQAFGLLGAGLGSSPLLTIALVVLGCGLLACGLMKARFETDEYKLWTETGGRLEDETDYTDSVLGEGSLPSNELLIQVARSGESAISREALEEHLKLVRQIATEAAVTMWDRTWRLPDLCFNVRPPDTVNYPYLDGIWREMNPCVILSVLDCFWDGSLVHDRQPYHLKVPGHDAHYDKNVTWATLDPEELSVAMDRATPPVNSIVQDSLAAAGFDGYVRKPCLHPHHPECPSTAANKNSGIESIDAQGIQDALSKGCTGFASAASKWPLPVIVSGEEWKTGGGSPAIQAIFRLHSEQKVLDMLQELAETPGKISNRNFSSDDASDLLKKWRKEFLKVVYDTEKDRKYTHAHAWTTDSAQGIIEQYSSGSAVLLVLGYVFMMIYAGVAFINIRSLVKSRVNVGIVGVLLVVISCLAGLGFSSLCGIPFNPTTTQVLPFLVLGLGVDDMFVMAHTFFAIFNLPKYRRLPLSEISKECLQRVGHSVTLTSFTNSAGFFLAAIIPIPAMRDFAFQVGICVVFNYLVILLALPAYLCIDGHRIRSGLCDGCCCRGTMLSFLCNCVGGRETGLARSYERQDTEHLNNQTPNGKPASTDISMTSEINGMSVSKTIPAKEPMSQSSEKSGSESQSWGDAFVCRVYAPLLLHPSVKAVVLLITAGVLSACLYGATKVENGLDLTEVVPSGTKEHDYVSATLKYFSFYDLYIVQDYNNDFPSLAVQQEMLNFHREFAKVKWILSGNRSVNNVTVYTVSEPFWLEKMIDFYVTLQKKYDEEVATQTQSLTFVLVNGYLLPQTGNGSRNETLPNIPGHKLFDNSTGRPLIPEDRFYVYLTAWANTDILFAEATQPSFRPILPKWPVAQDPYIIPARRLVFAQMPMFANSLKTSADHIELIKQTRDIIQDARSKGISAYPRGISFTFYEHYIGLQSHLGLAVGMILLACLLTTSVLLLSIWSGVIMAVMLALTAIEVYGFLGLANIQFSAIPCVTVIVSVGATVEFTAPLCLMFVKITGTRKERVEYALLYRFVPIFNGAVSTFLGFVMLAFSEFEFIFKYFFIIFIALIVAGTFNGLVLLPVVLSLVGPPPQVVPVQQKLEMQPVKGIRKYQNTNRSTGSVSHQHLHPDLATLPPDLDVLRDGTPV